MTSKTSQIQPPAEEALPRRSAFGRLFTLAAAVSLLLSVWVAFGWYRSSTRSGPFARMQVGTQSLAFYGGNLVYRRGVRPPGMFGGEPRFRGGSAPDGRFLPSRRVARVACLPLALALAVLPAAWLVRQSNRPLGKDERCPWCGYDIRATPFRCPDCGTELPAPKRASSTGEQQPARGAPDALTDHRHRSSHWLEERWARE